MQHERGRSCEKHVCSAGIACWEVGRSGIAVGGGEQGCRGRRCVLRPKDQGIGRQGDKVVGAGTRAARFSRLGDQSKAMGFEKEWRYGLHPVWVRGTGLPCRCRSPTRILCPCKASHQNVVLLGVFLMADWCLTLLGVFRDSSKLDVSGLLRHVSTQLAATQALLTDMMPAHIVRATLRRITSPAAAPGRRKRRSSSSIDKRQPLSGGEGGKGRSQDDLCLGGAAAGAAASLPAAPATTAAPLTSEQRMVTGVRRSRSFREPLQQVQQAALKSRQGAPSMFALASNGKHAASPPPQAKRKDGMSTRSSATDVVLTASNIDCSTAPRPRYSVRQSLLGHVILDEALEDYLRQEANDHAISTHSSGISYSGSTAELAGLHHTLAASHDSCTLFFSDIMGFSCWAGKLPPAKVRECSLAAASHWSGQ